MTVPVIWMLMSSRAGDNTQLLALGEALGLPFEVKRMAYRPVEWLPRIGLGASLIGIDRVRSSPLEPPYPDLILGAGRPTEAVAFWIRKYLNPKVKLAYLGTPWADLGLFDLVITTPQYRLPHRPNVLHNALPLHNVWPERLKEAAQEWEPRFAHLPSPRIGVLAGGRSGPYLFGPETAARLARQASDYARARGGSLLVTTSARTSKPATEALFGGVAVPAFRHDWRTGDGENPFHGILALANEIIVTADSISMIAEACATGKPVFLFDIEDGPRAMRAEEKASVPGTRLPAPYWKGGDFASTLWRLGLKHGPDWWTRDIRIVHRELIAEHRAAWLGDPATTAAADPALDMHRALARVRALLGLG